MAATDNASPRLYHVYRTFFKHDYTVTAADKSPLYFADNSTWTPKKPDLTFHEGTDDKAPIVASSNFLKFSRHCKVGLGDPNDVSNATWEDLLGEGYSHGKYSWQMLLDKDCVPNRYSFIWKRTSNVGVNDTRPSKLSTDNFKLVDEQTGQVLAAYSTSNHKSVDKAGKLEIYPDYGRDFELMTIATILSIVERHRRRNQRRAAAAGGGGGGGGGGG